MSHVDAVVTTMWLCSRRADNCNNPGHVHLLLRWKSIWQSRGKTLQGAFTTCSTVVI